MTARRLFVLFLALACAGCAAQHPRFTLFCERDEAATTGALPARTATNKVGASIAVDLP